MQLPIAMFILPPGISDGDLQLRMENIRFFFFSQSIRRPTPG
jgi:hypothetical protein